MKVPVTIESILITSKIISIKVRLNNPENGHKEMIEPLRDSTKYFHFEEDQDVEAQPNEKKRLFIRGQVKSINIRKDLTFVIHTGRPFLRIVTFLSLFIGKSMTLQVQEDKDNLIEEFLSVESSKTGTTPQEVLYKITSYSKNGKDYEGKRTVSELSDKQKDFIIKMLITKTMNKRQFIQSQKAQ